MDPSEQLLILHVSRSSHGGRHHSLRLRAPHALLRTIPSECPTLHVRGSLIGRLFILEAAHPYTRLRNQARWYVDEWCPMPDVDLDVGLAGRSLRPADRFRRSSVGRCYLNGKPLAREAFDTLLRAGALWSS